jgi:hypothetical protein
MTETARPKQLKEQNRGALLAAILANAAIFYLVANAQPISAEGLSGIISHWTSLIPATVAPFFVGLLNEVVDSNTKARLVFWVWKNPLPGSRAFTVYAKKDQRIDLQHLKSRLGKLPVAAKEQNSLWYKLSLNHAADPRVEHAHQGFLFARDYTAICALALLGFGGASLFFVRPLSLAGAYIVCLVAQFLVVRFSALHQGERFVCTVLALESHRSE